MPARKWRTLFLFEVLRLRRAAASAALVGIGICLADALHKKARTRAGNGNWVEGPLGLVATAIVEVGGTVVLALAPVHLYGTGMLGRIGDALFLSTELPSLGLHDMVDGRFFSCAHCKALAKFPNSCPTVQAYCRQVY